MVPSESVVVVKGGDPVPVVNAVLEPPGVSCEPNDVGAVVDELWNEDTLLDPKMLELPELKAPEVGVAGGPNIEAFVLPDCKNPPLGLLCVDCWPNIELDWVFEPIPEPNPPPPNIELDGCCCCCCGAPNIELVGAEGVEENIELFPAEAAPTPPKIELLPEVDWFPDPNTPVEPKAFPDIPPKTDGCWMPVVLVLDCDCTGTNAPVVDVRGCWVDGNVLPNNPPVVGFVLPNIIKANWIKV
jgi:hypothetical protein